MDGRYLVEDVLGRGGMSVVYRVRHATLGSLHALKVMLGTDTVAHERLMREGRVQAGLDHPNVLRVTDVVRLEHSTGLILEYVRGCNLDEALRDGLLRSWDDKDQVGRAILRGVKAAHAEGWLHRDLKPSNVLLAFRDDGWVVKVADFGLVRSTSGTASLTGEGSVVGTPAYMSPEQLFDAPIDSRGDIFALGAVLYELVTGHRAFVGGTFEAADRIRTGRFRPPREWAPELPERMERAILAALEVDLARRAATCDVLLSLWTGSVPAALPVSLGSGGRTPRPEQTSSPTFELSAVRPSSEPSRPDTSLEPLGPLPRRSWGPAVWGGTALLGIAGALALRPVLTTPPVLPPAPAPVSVVQVEPVPAPVPVVVAPTPVARPVVRPKPPLPAPAPPAPAVPSAGRLIVTGTAESVVLVAGDGRSFGAGDVPPGTYRLRASFGPDGDQSLGDTVVEAGATVRVDCDRRFTRCSVSGPPR